MTAPVPDLGAYAPRDFTRGRPALVELAWMFVQAAFVSSWLPGSWHRRFLLGLFLPPDSKNYIYRWFRRLTDWVIRPVAFITPSVFPPVLLPPIAAFWVVIARLAFFMIMFAAGLTPRPAAQ